MNSGIVRSFSRGLSPVSEVLRSDRVGRRVAATKSPETIGEVWHRAILCDPKASLDEPPVLPVLHLGEVCKDRRLDPPVACRTGGVAQRVPHGLTRALRAGV